MELPLKFKIAGMKHANRIAHVKYAHWQSKFILQREPDNRFDKNAIRILLPVKKGSVKLMLGYVPAKHAKELAPMIDDGMKLEAKFRAKIVDDTGITHGLIITIDDMEAQNDRGTENIFD